MLAVVLALAPAAGASADQTTPEPLRQRVHVYVLDFSDCDVGTGAFRLTST